MTRTIPRVRLGDVADLNPRADWDLNDDDTVSFLPMSAVDAERVDAVDVETRELADVKKGYTPFRRDDVLVAKITPCFENGKIAQARLTRPYGFGSTEFHVVRPKAGKLDARFLAHYLRQKRILIDGERKMTGSAGQRRVPEHFLSGLQIPAPPLPQQRRIAEILDKAEALRAKRRAAIAQLDTLTQSIFLDMFGDPATNAKRWPEDKVLGDVADIASGVTIGRKLEGKITRSVPYLAVVNVQDGHLDLKVVKTTHATEDEIQRYRLLNDDLLLTEGGDPDKLGRGALWADQIPECIHQNHVFRVRFQSKQLRPLFLSWLIGSQRGKRYFLRSAKQTTGIASINMTQLRAFPLIVPPMNLQDEFERQMKVCAKLKCSHSKALDELDGLFASLQQRAFNGAIGEMRGIQPQTARTVVL